MSANLYAGEVGIDWGDLEFLFRPSFAAMGSLGTPLELARLLADIQRTEDWHRVGAMLSAISVIRSCYTGSDPDALDRLVGVYREFKGRLRWVLGSMPAQNIHVIGVRLLVAGMIGEPRPRRGEKKGASSAFDPAEYVAHAQAHLGLSAADAWNMTMIEFQRAMDAKFPEQKGKEMPSEEESQALITHIDEIRRRRAEKNRKT